MTTPPPEAASAVANGDPIPVILPQVRLQLDPFGWYYLWYLQPGIGWVVTRCGDEFVRGFMSALRFTAVEIEDLLRRAREGSSWYDISAPTRTV